MPSSGMLRRVALLRTDVSEERSASIIRVTRVGELGTLVITSNGGDYEECCLLGIEPQFVPHRKHITSPLQSPTG
jgi:hypothetical protein